MSCNCAKKTIVFKNEKFQIYDRKTAPFDSCLVCAKKHIGFALFLYDRVDKKRAITNLYLAYKHLEKRYADMAKTVFELYRGLLTGEKTEDDIKIFVKFFWSKIALLNAEESELETKLNLEDTLSDEDKIKTYIYTAYQLLFHQFGYQLINKSYAVGYLQGAVELETDKQKKQLIRTIWIKEDKESFEKVLSLYL